VETTSEAQYEKFLDVTKKITTNLDFKNDSDLQNVIETLQLLTKKFDTNTKVTESTKKTLQISTWTQTKTAIIKSGTQLSRYKTRKTFDIGGMKGESAFFSADQIKSELPTKSIGNKDEYCVDYKIGTDMMAGKNKPFIITGMLNKENSLKSADPDNSI